MPHEAKAGGIGIADLAQRSGRSAGDHSGKQQEWKRRDGRTGQRAYRERKGLSGSSRCFVNRMLASRQIYNLPGFLSVSLNRCSLFGGYELWMFLHELLHRGKQRTTQEHSFVVGFVLPARLSQLVERPLALAEYVRAPVVSPRSASCSARIWRTSLISRVASNAETGRELETGRSARVGNSRPSKAFRTSIPGRPALASAQKRFCWPSRKCFIPRLYFAWSMVGVGGATEAAAPFRRAGLYWRRRSCTGDVIVDGILPVVPSGQIVVEGIVGIVMLTFVQLRQANWGRGRPACSSYD